MHISEGSSWGEKGPYITPKKLVRKSSERFHEVSGKINKMSLFSSKNSNDARRSLTISVTFSMFGFMELFHVLVDVAFAAQQKKKEIAESSPVM